MVERTDLRIDVSSVAPPGVRRCAVTVVAGTHRPPAGRPVVAVCLPGGSMTRRYFDLDVPPGHGGYSMAAHLAERGTIVVTVDPPGVGDSDVPDDGFALTPDCLADIVAAVSDRLLAGLRAGTLTAGLPPLADPLLVGLGHSAGALLTVHAQARHRPFGAVALLGFSGSGLMEALTDDERAYAGDPAGARAALPRLVAARFEGALPPPPRPAASMFSGGPEPDAVKDAMRRARAPLLALLGLVAMIPGASAPELATIDVPVFVGVGRRDITGDPRAIPAHFPAATDITLFVLADAGHVHNVAPTRVVLWDRVASWIDAMR